MTHDTTHRGVLWLLAALTLGGTTVAFMSCATMSPLSTPAQSHAVAAVTSHDESGMAVPPATKH